MKKLLITGATGFIGCRCLELLSAGNQFEIHAVSSKNVGSGGSGVNWHRINLLDFNQTAKLITQIKPTHLLHLAWYTEPGSCYSSFENMKWVESSLALLNKFQLNGGKRVVFSGTCAEYDWNYGFCTEDITPLKPATFYGTCKHALQIMLSSFSEIAGISSAWGRIFFVYGPNDYDSKLVPSIIRSILLGEPADCSHGNQIRDYLYVDDVASALVAILDSDVQGPINIASGKPIPLKEIINKISEKLSGKHLVRFGALPTAPHEPDLIVGNIHRLLKEAGWQPTYTIDNGLDITISHFKRLLNKEKAS